MDDTNNPTTPTPGTDGGTPTPGTDAGTPTPAPEEVAPEMGAPAQ
ncbi:MAG: hypothetical protein WD963_00940 [Candidatus Paceibacterota bacterium]